MLKKWRQTMEKQWKNCGFDGTSIESKYSQKTIASANETVDTVQRLGLVCRGRCISVLVEMCHALGTATRVSIDVFFGILYQRGLGERRRMARRLWPSIHSKCKKSF